MTVHENNSNYLSEKLTNTFYVNYKIIHCSQATAIIKNMFIEIAENVRYLNIRVDMYAITTKLIYKYWCCKFIVKCQRRAIDIQGQTLLLNIFILIYNRTTCSQK